MINLDYRLDFKATLVIFSFMSGDQPYLGKRNQINKTFYDSFAPLYTLFRQFGHRWDRSAKYSMIKHLEPFGNDTILDVGTGPGIYAIDIAKMAPDSRVHGIDISPKFLEIANRRASEKRVKNVKFRLGNIESLDFESATFSKIICAGVISLVDNRHQAIRELSRVLKGGGVLVIREPLRKTDWKNRVLAKLTASSSHKFGLMFGHFNPSFFDEEEFADLLNQGGFKKIKINNQGSDLFGICVK